ncbi:four-carbon acid sugar kinase family protein [Mesobacterium pallidum]|uniref:four-carbon acid sugar kinase family protein n=1 Tax=Mesobacterium pallidum TaxID=2872037 RepID=UPI001EE19E57|nr:four-carbon acid sugar kinase family protein [Mesobacterium pallidum]
MAPRLTFYGDDFTGSTAVMEVLTFAGVPTLLFLAPPAPEVLARYPEAQAIGVAGIARSQTPDWMRAELPPIFAALRRLGAPLVHYKVCSTFDSAPHVGSIGAAAEIGAEVFAPDWIPLVVGAPAIGRYQVFGNLFAGSESGIHRLDRHPVMARHPVTPMDEADLCRHLSRQTDMATGVVDMAAMTSGRGDAALAEARATGARIIALDALDDATLAEAGRLMWAGGAGGFVLGSQGVEYALTAYWRRTGLLPAEPEPSVLTPVDQLFAVSGSCAPTTATQIARADAAGFAVLDLDASDPGALAAEAARTLDAALDLLGQGRDVLVATARGPDDPRVTRLSAAENDSLGAALGQIVAEIRRRTGLPRIAIAGGDTSGHALSVLGAEALSAVAPLAPGAPLCRVHCPADATLDGLEVTLKGGQMGAPDFFITTKTGATRPGA